MVAETVLVTGATGFVAGHVIEELFRHGSAVPRDEQEVIRPAVDGTLRVLRAAAADGGIRRVVLTSSIAAVTAGRATPKATAYTEDDWSVADQSPPYEKSKTLAERAAWDFVADLPEDRRFDLVALNPGLVLGPPQHRSVATSTEVIRLILTRRMPAIPRLGFAPVDVRDLAVAHRLAMES